MILFFNYSIDEIKMREDRFIKLLMLLAVWNKMVYNKYIK